MQIFYFISLVNINSAFSTSFIFYEKYDTAVSSISCYRIIPKYYLNPEVIRKLISRVWISDPIRLLIGLPFSSTMAFFIQDRITKQDMLDFITHRDCGSPFVSLSLFVFISNLFYNYEQVKVSNPFSLKILYLNLYCKFLSLRYRKP